MLKNKCVVKKNISLGIHVNCIYILYFMECPINSRRNSVSKWSKLKYLINFKKINQMRFKLRAFKVKRNEKNSVWIWGSLSPKLNITYEQ